MESTVVTSLYNSPCGELLLGSWNGKLCLCDWNYPQRREKIDHRIKRALRADYVKGVSEVIWQAKEQLDEYFLGRRISFSLPLLFVGTDFQKRVWQSLLRIPYGHTHYYIEQASALGIPEAVRAVAAANGANALSIVVPCHRIVGKDGSLTGYAGGLQAKRFLLDLEKQEKSLSQ